MTTAAILLAAGESSRMGRPKALLPWGGVTLIEYQVRELRGGGVKEIVVVLGHAADEVRPLLPADARVALNEAYREGRASSLRTGAAALPANADPIVIVSVDQPRPREIIRALLTAHREGGAALSAPVAQGRRGHPIVLAGSLLAELREAEEETRGLRGIIAAHEAELREIELGSAEVLLDINTPEEYEEALARFDQRDPDP